jgi:hypothetical protein
MRKCQVCDHPERRNIDTALLARDGVRDVARRYGVDKSAVSRHLNQHLRPTAAGASLQEAVRAVDAIARHSVELTVLQAMRDLHARTLALLAQAEHASDHFTALRAIGECRRNLELVAKLTGELDPRAAGEAPSGPINITVQYVDKQLVAGAASRLLEDGK